MLSTAQGRHVARFRDEGVPLSRCAQPHPFVPLGPVTHDNRYVAQHTMYGGMRMQWLLGNDSQVVASRLRAQLTFHNIPCTVGCGCSGCWGMIRTSWPPDCVHNRSISSRDTLSERCWRLCERAETANPGDQHCVLGIQRHPVVGSKGFRAIHVPGTQYIHTIENGLNRTEIRIFSTTEK